MTHRRCTSIADEWDSFCIAAVPVSVREMSTVIAELRKCFMAGVLVGCDHMNRALLDRTHSAALMDELQAYHAEQLGPGGHA